MNYSILIYEGETGFALRTDPVDGPAYWAAWPAYSQALQQAGVFVSGAGLEVPETATTIRVVDGKHRVQDGPFAETKEQLGGFYIIDVPDLDTALEWASRTPAAKGSVIEVRPVLTRPAQPASTSSAAPTTAPTTA
ncbi:MAG TPA: YciI family protein [Pararobbsia sp.]|nr:YciI family protein [Pararobbsia sp.]